MKRSPKQWRGLAAQDAPRAATQAPAEVQAPAGVQASAATRVPAAVQAAATGVRYVVPGSAFGRRAMNVLNSAVAWLTRRGVSVWGSRVLYVRGRSTGELRSNPVNVLTVDDRRYLVAPRGHTQWVRNLRVAGQGELRVGRRIERFTAAEVADADKPPILRAYLRRWRFEVGAFFDGAGPDAPEPRLLEMAPGYPVFVLVAAETGR